MSENRLTPELREKLLNRLPFSRSATIDYTPKPYLTKVLDSEGKETDEYDIPEEYRPIFVIRPLSEDEKTKIGSMKNMEEKVLREIVRANIVNVTRYYDAGTMEEIEFKGDPKTGMDKSQFDGIPFMVIKDIFIKVTAISGMAPHERAGL